MPRCETFSGASAAMTDKTNHNKAIIIEVLTSAFTKRDFAALERWFSPDYIQHNPFIPGSRAGLRGFVENLPKGRSYEPGMAVAEGDLVMIHGRYSGGTGKTLIAIDIFRFEDDRVVEHWDVLQEEVPVDKTVAGNPMFMSVARKN
jgi:predicted SnoaL-like aldol condensation-catalyzing enzyme